MADGNKRPRLLVSQSEVDTFRTCRQKWGFRYLEGLVPRTEGKALRVGRAVHDGIAAAYRAGMAAGGPVDAGTLRLKARRGVVRHFAETLGYPEACHEDRLELDEETRELLERSIDTAIRFVNAFVVRDLERYEVIAVEERFELPLRDGNGTRRPGVDTLGFIDLVLRDPASNEWIVGEHKTTSDDCSTFDARLDVDPQTPGYVYAANEETERGRWQTPEWACLSGGPAQVGRVFLSVVRTKGQSTPKVNKIARADVCRGGAGFGCEPNAAGKITKHAEACSARLEELKATEEATGRPAGLVSRAEVDCDQETYRAALVDQGRRLAITPTAEQNDRLETLPAGSGRWAMRHEWFYTSEDVDRWRREHLADARMIRQARALRLPLTRNGSSCSPQNALPCAYRSVCVNDRPEVREEGFEVREGRGRS